MKREGFLPNFIDPNINIGMPELSPEIHGDVVRYDGLESGYILKYVNYSVIMHKQSKQPLVVGLNIHQNQFQTTTRRSWRTDSRIPSNYQLNNTHYSKQEENYDFDKGHMAMKHNASWGKTTIDAQLASDDTMYYTNAAFQRDTMNQDEWLMLEKWIGDFAGDENDHLSVFTGPIFTNLDRYYSRAAHDPVRIPSAFFKILCYKDKVTNKLATRAFIMWQDDEITKDFKGKKFFKSKNFQVSVREIEERTGLEFDHKLFDTNPNYFYESDKAKNLNISSFPERKEINTPEEIITPDETREKEVELNVEIIAALVNPVSNSNNEWVSIFNYSNKQIQLNGWKIKDKIKRATPLNGIMGPGQAKRISLLDSSTRLANTGGSISMYTEKDELVCRVGYTEKQGKQKGVVIRF